jgi:hypothetical protein
LEPVFHKFPQIFGDPSASPTQSPRSPFPHPAVPCNPDYALKILLAIIIAAIIIGSLIADYKWRQWIAARKRDRQ